MRSWWRNLRWWRRDMLMGRALRTVVEVTVVQAVAQLQREEEDVASRLRQELDEWGRR